MSGTIISQGLATSLKFSYARQISQASAVYRRVTTTTGGDDLARTNGTDTVVDTAILPLPKVTFNTQDEVVASPADGGRVQDGDIYMDVHPDALTEDQLREVQESQAVEYVV